MTDLPWNPSSGQTSLRVIERSEAFVLCEDKGSLNHRYLFTLDGRLVTVTGSTLTLKAKVMKPEPVAEPEPNHFPGPGKMVSPAPTARRGEPPSTKQKPAQMSLF